MTSEKELELLKRIALLEKRLNAEEKNRVPSFTFSKITFDDLDSLVDIKQNLEVNIFKSWLNNDLNLTEDTTRFLAQLIQKESRYISVYNEEDLKINLIAPILSRIDFKITEYIRAFYDEKLTYETDEFILTGLCDFYVSKGLRKAEQPYFFIQEFKKGLHYSNPQPQLLAELISAIELNGFTTMKGAYIVGAIWNFVILEKQDKNQYQYFVSENFDSTKINDLKAIYKNLLFVKTEIIKMAETN